MARCFEMARRFEIQRQDAAPARPEHRGEHFAERLDAERRELIP
jgi:hypothetical protein